MDLQQNTTSQVITNTGDMSVNKYKNIINKVLNCVNDHMLVLVNQMISTADEKLFDQSEKAKNDEERMKFMDCTKIFRTEKNDISRHFFINLNNSLRTSENDQMAEDEDLRLVDQDEMEEMVAITTMHSKAMSLYGVEVNNLEARLEYLEIMCEDIFDKESLDPKHLCEILEHKLMVQISDMSLWIT